MVGDTEVTRHVERQNLTEACNAAAQSRPLVRSFARFTSANRQSIRGACEKSTRSSPDVYPALSFCGRRTRTDSVPPRARLNPNNRAVPGLQATH